MPRMTTDLLGKCTGQAKRKRDESLEQFLRRITHLYCSDKGVETIEGLSTCRNLTVLYLYDNKLSSIENLSTCTSLTHLYLQNNNISSIRNLAPLYRLTKLYLNGNAITVVEGLEALKNLTELHVAQQRLPEGEKLLFDPRTIQALADRLNVLNVSGNNLDSISDLRCLTELTKFTASDNQLTSMRELSQVLEQWSRLIVLELTGNPLCQKYKYRDRVITMGRYIGTLDGREVSENERQFLMNWKAMRIARRNQQKPDLFDQLAEQGTTVAYSNKHKTGVAASKTALLATASLPVTLPALPARQPIRRCRRVITQYQDSKDYGAMSLPKIVSDYKPSLVAQRSVVVVDPLLLMIQHQHTVGWRPVHATGGPSS